MLSIDMCGDWMSISLNLEEVRGFDSVCVLRDSSESVEVLQYVI